jgi:hypothetical protein
LSVGAANVGVVGAVFAVFAGAGSSPPPLQERNNKPTTERYIKFFIFIFL